MTEQATCPECGSVLPPDSPEGLCVKCLYQAALQDQGDRHLHIRCPHCQFAVEIVDDSPLRELACPSCDTHFSLVGDDTILYAPETSNTIGHFELIERIGMGAFGTVWKARDTELDRSVAIKIPRKGQLSPAEMEQFLREARAAAQLKHPNIVSVHEIGREEDTIYIVSDFVEGVNLADWLTGQQSTPREAAGLCTKIAEALHHAHENGVVHRDLKPSNIMLRSDLEPHIMDFGLAKREAGEITMTVEGKVLGTPAYMSPEQAKGEAHAADRRSDVYSLGVILFELLTGEQPFRGSMRMLLHQVINDEPPSPRKLNGSVPRDLETICLKCLQKEPQKRYPSAAALAEDLKRFITGQPILARPVGSVERMWRWCRRNAALATTGALALVASIVVVCLSIGFAIHQSRAATTLRRTLAENYLDRGLSLCEQDDASRGMLWLARGLETAPADAADLRQAIRTNMAAWQRYVSELKVVLWHPDTGRNAHAYVQDVAFSPDGQTVLTGGSDMAQRWDAVTGQRIGEPLLHPGGRIQGVAFNFDGTRIVTAGNKTVQVWDALSGSAIAEPLQHESSIDDMAISPDGKTVLIGGADGIAVLLDLATGKRVGEPFPHGAEFLVVAFSPEGSRVLTGGLDGTARLWDRATGKAIGEPLKHTGRDSRDGRGVNAVAFSPDGTTILTGGWDRTVRLWNAETGKSLGEPLMHEAGVEEAVFSPDGRLILTGCIDNAAYLWDRATGRRVGEPMRHRKRVFAVAFSPDGETLLTGSNDSTARLWKRPREKPSPTTLPVRDALLLAISPDGHTIATGRGSFARLWNADTAEPIGSPVRHPEWIRQIGFLPNRTVAVIGTHSVQFLDGTSGESTGRFHDPKQRVWAVSPDGQRILTTAARSNIGRARTSKSRPSTAYRPAVAQVRDVTTGAAIGHPLRHENDARYSSVLRAAVFSPDGKLVLTGTNAILKRVRGKNTVWDGKSSPVSRYEKIGEARLWDAATGKLIGGPFEQKWAVEVLAFSPDGKTFLTGGRADRRNFVGMRLWATASGRPIGPERAVTVERAAFSPDGTIVATAGGTAARLWNATTGEPIGRPLQHQQSVTSVTFSPDGRLVLTGSEDKTARLWNTMTGWPVGPAFPHAGGVGDVVFSPDGSRFIAGVSQGTAAIWKVPPTTLDGSKEQIIDRVSVITSMRLDSSGVIEVLDAPEWDTYNQRHE